MIYIRKYLFLFLTLICFLTELACTALQNGQPTINTGVFGKVVWLEGSLMPSPDRVKNTEGQPIQRTIKFYKVTNMKQTSGQAPLFKSVTTPLIAETKSNKNGYFQCKLKPGLYSCFTVEPDGVLFANDFNSNGDIGVFEIKEGQITNLVIKINYKAAF